MPAPSKPAGYKPDRGRPVTITITPAKTARISCQTWSQFHMRMVQLGVLVMDPDIARRAFWDRGYSVGERILSRDGQRVWTISRRQRRGK